MLAGEFLVLQWAHLSESVLWQCKALNFRDIAFEGALKGVMYLSVCKGQISATSRIADPTFSAQFIKCFICKNVWGLSQQVTVFVHVLRFSSMTERTSFIRPGCIQKLFSDFWQWLLFRCSTGWWKVFLLFPPEINWVCTNSGASAAMQPPSCNIHAHIWALLIQDYTS